MFLIRSSITRIILTIVLIFSLVITLGVYLINDRQETALFNDYKKYLINHQKVQQGSIDRVLDSVELDVLALANHDALIRLGKQPANSDFDITNQLYKEVEGLLKAFAQTSDDYRQVRFISSKLEGQEVIRIDRDGNNVYSRNPQDLQNKSDRYYYTDTLSLSKGDIFYSEFDLNKEFGQIEQPLRPMLRVATPVYDGSDVLGIIIINLGVGPLLEQLGTGLDFESVYKSKTYVANARGEWIYHDDKSRLFGVDLEHDFGMMSDFPEISATTFLLNESTFSVQSDINEKRGSLISLSKLKIGHRNDLHLDLIYEKPISDFDVRLASLRSDTILFGLLAALLIILPLIFFVYRQLNPIRELTKVAHKISQGDYGASLPSSNDEEVSQLVLALTTLRSAVAKREASLKERETYARSIIDLIPQGLAVVDSNGFIVQSNDTFGIIFECKGEIIEGESIDRFVPNDIHEGHATLVKAYFENPEKRIFDGVNSLHGLTAMGNIISVEIGLAPLVSKGETFAILTVVDISERRAMELELEEYRADLESIVQQRTEELNKTNESLSSSEKNLKEALQAAESANRSKSDFLANTSHEIRTPMNAILGFAYLLNKPEQPESVRGVATHILGAGQTLMAIINDILDFSKIEAGKLELQPVPFNLHDVLDNLSFIMASNVGDKPVEVAIHHDDDLPMFWIADRLRLEQVLINLLGNAIKFTSEGYVKLTVHVLSSHETSYRLKFSIEDTGMGIEPGSIEKIMHPFEQADSSTTREFGGTGLGLAICQRILELMGGQLLVQSEFGKGSTFYFEIDLQEDTSQVQPSGQITDLNLVVVDDHDIARQALKQVVTSLGWRADIYEDGLELLEVIERDSTTLPEVFLIDWDMPTIDGLSLSKALKKYAAQQQIDLPMIVMVSAYSRDTILANPDAQYLDAIIEKPITASRLYDTVSSLNQSRFNLNIDDSSQNLSIIETSEPSVTLDGLHLLVVDDNEYNREVARRIFESGGATVNTCDDGQQAVDWLNIAESAPDVVLMDIQMPVLNGYEATAAIRAMPQYKDLPIIALTAGAYESNRRAALDAGMNEFLSKPFDVEKAYRKIKYVVTKELSPGSIVKPIKQPAKTDSSLSETNYHLFDFKEALVRWGSQETLEQYLQLFIRDYAGASASMSEMSTEEVATYAHKYKGAASALCLEKLQDIATEIQDSAEQGLFNKESVDALKTAFDETEALINQKIIRKSSNQEALVDDQIVTPVDKGELIERLKEVRSSLSENNPDQGLTLMFELKEKITPSQSKEIIELIESFEFRLAEAALDELIKFLEI